MFSRHCLPTRHHLAPRSEARDAKPKIQSISDKITWLLGLDNYTEDQPTHSFSKCMLSTYYVPGIVRCCEYYDHCPLLEARTIVSICGLFPQTLSSHFCCLGSLVSYLYTQLLLQLEILRFLHLFRILPQTLGS